MRSRRRARESALQALYQCDTLEDWGLEAIRRYFTSFRPASLLTGDPADELALDTEAINTEKVARLRTSEGDNFHFTENLIFGTIEYLDFVDQQLAGASTHWSVPRMSRVDRNILRIAVYEMAFLADIPVNVSINEAIEVAKSYGSEDSPMFVNGVLDNVAKALLASPDMVAHARKVRSAKLAVAG